VDVLNDIGEVIQSFGARFGPPNPRLQQSLSRGEIACLDKLDRIVLAPLSLPELRAYASNGQLVWSREIPDYLPVKVEAINQGVRYTASPGGNDQLVSMVVTVALS
jgi:hypothetical protein